LDYSELLFTYQGENSFDIANCDIKLI